jgi:NTE family protein
VKNLGFSPGKVFLGWVEQTLAEYGIETTRQLTERMAETPADMHHRNGEPLAKEPRRAELALVAAEVVTETKTCFPKMAGLFWEEPETINPSLFVRASMSVPFFFQPLRVKKLPQDDGAWERWERLASYDGPLPTQSLFVDGGIMSNFPIDLFHTREQVPACPTFGIKLGRQNRTLQNVDDPRRLGVAMFNAARHCLDYDFLHKHPDYEHLIGYIDTGEHHWLNFELTDEAKIDLFRRGVEEAADFLRGFNWKRYKGVRQKMVKSHQAARRLRPPTPSATAASDAGRADRSGASSEPTGGGRHGRQRFNR